MAKKKPRKRKWYTLYDKVFAIKTLKEAWMLVKSNKGSAGVDKESIEEFAQNEDRNIEELHRFLRQKRYKPKPVRRVYIPKPDGGRRPLGIPAIRDRIVQQALLLVLQPIFEGKFKDNSFGFRPQKGTHNAPKWVRHALSKGYDWIVDADIKQPFDTVPHHRLIDEVAEEIADGSVLRLVEAFLKSGVM
jgi:group II intron reverse transcriptase/maturase